MQEGEEVGTPLQFALPADFLLVFHYVFHYFWSSNGLKLASIFDRFLNRFYDASWSDFGRVLGGQDAAMTAHDAAKTAQDDTKMAPRRRQDGVRWVQDAPRTRPDASKAVVNSNMSKKLQKY